MHLRPEWIDWLIMRLQPSRKMSFNVIKFDEYLHQQFGEYENDGKSMAAIIEEHFGASASKLIQDHLIEMEHDENICNPAQSVLSFWTLIFILGI